MSACVECGDQGLSPECPSCLRREPPGTVRRMPRAPNAPALADGTEVAQLRAECARLRAALERAIEGIEFVLRFHRGGHWTEEDSRLWARWTGGDDATTRAMCDQLRQVRNAALAEIRECLGGGQ